MRANRLIDNASWLLALLVLLAGIPEGAAAQTGSVSGTVVDETEAPVAGAQVSIAGTGRGTITATDGRFMITNVPAGTQQLRVRYVGYGEQVVPVEVQSGQTANARVQLESAAIELGGVIVSASRRPERVTEAPATVTRIDPTVIENAVGNTFAGALKQVPGLDFVQVGINSVGINARGFNSSFNNRMLMMEDGRISVLPESGLPIGAFTATPKIDLAGIEVLVGPGSALYGPDASSGVLYLQTKDPRRYPGLTAEVTGGTRAYRDIQMRYAGVSGDWGYKVAGEYQEADDWDNYPCYNAGGSVVGASTSCGAGQVGESQLKTPISWDSQVARGTGGLWYYFGPSQLELTTGVSQTDGIGQTNVGRNQFKDWRYNFQQARLTTPNWFFNLYRTQSQSGESFALNRYAGAQLTAANATLSADSLRLLSDWPSNGRLYAAEVQNNFSLPMLNNTAIIWGAQVRRDVVSSDRQWLTDRLTGGDVTIEQYGVYAQVEAPLSPQFDFIAAGRVDKHENYSTQFSPKAGVVFKLAQDQALRLTYNRAFKSPSILQTNFFIPDWTAAVAIFGNTEGYTVRRADGSVKAEYDALVPEQNQTWELGYKGVLAERLFVDITGYRAKYENFLSPLTIISDPFGFGLAGDPAGTKSFAYTADGEVVNHAGGYPPLTLIYTNLGDATLNGMDAGANFLLTPKVGLKGTLSYVAVSDEEAVQQFGEAASLNSPEWKWTLGANLRDISNFQGGMTLRHVGEYYFRSGVNRGVIPNFTTLDLSVGYTIPQTNALLSASVSNLFSCGGTFDYAPADALKQDPTDESRSCGSGRKHFEMINMPAIGTMLYVGVKYHLPN